MTIVAQQFNVRSEKILFLAMAMLRFAAKYPRKVGDNGIPVPWRTGFALFGPLTVAKTIRSLRGVWALPYGLKDDSLELSLFTRQYKQPGFWIPEDKREEFGEMDEKEIYEWEQISLMPNPELLAAWVGKLRSDELTPLELSFFFGNERVLLRKRTQGLDRLRAHARRIRREALPQDDGRDPRALDRAQQFLLLTSSS